MKVENGRRGGHQCWLLSIAILAVMFSVSCTPVKEYEKMYVNDHDMELSNKPTERTETNFMLYREGSAGANGGKTGGGCGCN
jgi:hypothetical protein